MCYFLRIFSDKLITVFFFYYIKVSLLEEKLREKEIQHTEVLLRFQETQKNFSELQESASMFAPNVTLLNGSLNVNVVFHFFRPAS